MGPFGILDPADPAHQPGADCPACAAGFPVRCGRSVDRRHKAVAFDDAGATTRYDWVDTHCVGFVHGERGTTGVIETRCEACGVPP